MEKSLLHDLVNRHWTRNCCRVSGHPAGAAATGAPAGRDHRGCRHGRSDRRVSAAQRRPPPAHPGSQRLRRRACPHLFAVSAAIYMPRRVPCVSPSQHELVSAFADLFKLPREPFFNVDIDFATHGDPDPGGAQQ